MLGLKAFSFLSRSTKTVAGPTLTPKILNIKTLDEPKQFNFNDFVQKRSKSYRNIAAAVTPRASKGVGMNMHKGDPVIPLTIPLKESAGRNNQGRISIRHRGCGDKKTLRIVDFNRDLRNIPAKVLRFETDPNRSAPIALVAYDNGVLAYILAPRGLRIGDEVISSVTAPIKPGNHVPIGTLPIGTQVHNLEFTPYKGGQIVRTAGNGAMIVRKTDDKVTVKMRSGEERLFSWGCWGTIGSICDYQDMTGALKQILGKAGAKRHMGFRPTVRGRAMNPVDHPMGGNSGGGRPSVSPWAQLCKVHYPTRDKRKQNKSILVLARINRRAAKEANKKKSGK